MTLRQGDRGPAVRELQLLLTMTGHDPGPIDGVFGIRTGSAAASLRMYTNWAPDARWDDEDIAALRALPRHAVELPRILTPIAAVDMRIALVAGYADAFHEREGIFQYEVGGGPVARAVRVALAQLAVEHGCEPWGHRASSDLGKLKLLPPTWLQPQVGELAYVSVWDFNIGNRQVRAEDRLPGHLAILYGPMVPWFSMSPVEGSGTSAHRATSAHYAYPNAAEGAARYWRFLRDHCGPALAAFERGDPAAAAHELKHGGWGYSGDEGDYTRGMVDRFRGIE